MMLAKCFGYQNKLSPTFHSAQLFGLVLSFSRVYCSLSLVFIYFLLQRESARERENKMKLEALGLRVGKSRARATIFQQSAA